MAEEFSLSRRFRVTQATVVESPSMGAKVLRLQVDEIEPSTRTAQLPLDIILDDFLVDRLAEIVSYLTSETPL